MQNTKPTVHYLGMPDFHGKCAILIPVDHQNHIEGQDVANNIPAITSKIVHYDKETGRIETMNTVYMPLNTANA